VALLRNQRKGNGFKEVRVWAVDETAAESLKQFSAMMLRQAEEILHMQAELDNAKSVIYQLLADYSDTGSLSTSIDRARDFIKNHTE
jgi:hypothetical protein